MQLTCPHCDFSKAIDPAKAPPRPVKVNCPKCSQSFRFDGATQSQPPDPPSVSNDEQTVAPAQIICPVCGLNQPQGVSCSGCGVVYAKLPPQQGRAGFAQQPGESVTSALRAELRDPDPQQQPKAGFWVRFVACLLDSVLVGVVQLVLSLLFWAIIGMTGLASAEDPAINMVVSLFGIV
ncbi:MAG: zinc-ribbon domain-containing protein, partial [Desulfuromonadales bacterium]|nr:zinc-ribbon domain-containing protein [Desulfuromonadales bacterium]